MRWFYLLCLLPLIPGNTISAADKEPARRESPPNIIYIMADDLGYGELGCYGQKWINTPRIDALAEQGIRFSQFYSGTAICAPARYILMTGRHSGRAAIRDNRNPPGMEDLREKYQWQFPGQQPLPPDTVTVASLLRERGYATAAIGKWGLGHVGTTGDPNRHGFDLFFGYLCQVHAHNHYPRFLWRNDRREPQAGNDRTLHGKTYSQDRFTEEALEFIRENRGRPFFLYLPLAIPHLSIQVPEESLREYRETIPEEDYEHRGYLRHPFPRAGYAAMVSHMDRDVGRIVDLVDELGLGERTLILFTSDNGPTFNRLGGSDSDFFESAGPLRGLKGSLYEGGIRVPLVARWTGRIPPGSESDHLSAMYDMLPTFAESAGAETPVDIDGISLLPALLGRAEQQPRAEYLYWEFPGYGGQQAVRRGDWKAIRRQLNRLRDPERIVTELYNLRDDIGEQHDLASEHPELLAELERIMREARTPSELFPIRVLDALH